MMNKMRQTSSSEKKITSDIAKIAILTSGYTQALELIANNNQIDLLIHNQPTGDTTPILKRLKTLARRLFSNSVNVATWARNRNIEELSLQHHDQEEIAKHIKTRNIDILITYFAPILKESIINAPKLLAINVHPSNLPAYRGGNPLLWQIIDGVKQSAVTVHLLTAKIDRGDILYQQSFQIPDGASKDNLLQVVNSVVAEAINTVLSMLKNNELNSFMPQQQESPTAFACNIKRESIMTKIGWQELSGRSLFNLTSYLGFFPIELTEKATVSHFLPLMAHSYLEKPIAINTGLIKHQGSWYFNSHKGALKLKYCWSPICILRHFKIKQYNSTGHLKKGYL